MLKKIIIFSTLAMFLSACVTGPEGYLKRSANNKIIDRKSKAKATTTATNTTTH